MSNAALVENYNFLQRSLIPAESELVRSAMRLAAKFGNSENLFKAHLLSVACAIGAVVLSFFNAISYLLQVPFKILLNIARFSPLQVVLDFFGDIRNAALSFVFVSLGVTLVVAGLLFPGTIFTLFAPEFPDSREKELDRRNTMLEKENAKLLELNQGKDRIIEKIGNILDKQEKELESFKSIKPEQKHRRFCC